MVLYHSTVKSQKSKNLFSTGDQNVHFFRSTLRVKTDLRAMNSHLIGEWFSAQTNHCSLIRKPFGVITHSQKYGWSQASGAWGVSDSPNEIPLVQGCGQDLVLR